MTKTIALVAACVMAVASMGYSLASAQETPVWSDIDCGQSQLVAPSGLRCRSTQVYSGSASAISGASGGGQRRRWVSFGVVGNSKIYVHCLDEVGARSSAVTGPLDQEIRGLSPYAKNAKNFSEQMSAGGASYETFTSENGEKCVAVRKLGPVRANGYKWILGASKCAPAGKALSQDDIVQFIAQVDFRG